ICKKYKGIPEEVVDNTLIILVENEYLLTDLRLPAYCDDGLKHIIQIIRNNEKVKHITDSLEELERIIDMYNKNKMIAAGIEALEKIYKIMGNIYDFKDYLEINRGLILENTKFIYH